MKKILLLICLLFIMCGCTGDKYDNLKVIDGEGRVLLLKHNIFDTYFIQNLSPEKDESPNSKINKKLEEKISTECEG